MLYYPTRHKYVDDAKLAYKPKEIKLNLKDKQKTSITGWYFDANPKKEPHAIILFFHGNGQNLSSHFYSLYWLLEHNYDYFIFDYPGYGASQGVPNPYNTILSGHAAVEYVQQIRGQTPWVIFAQSLGGAVGLQTASEITKNKPCLIIAESTFHSYKKVGASVLSKNWWSWPLQPLAYVLLSDRYAPRKHISNLSPTPLVVIHGNKDTIVDIKLGEKVFELAREPKEFWLVPDGKHIDAFTGGNKLIYQKKLRDALKKNCSTL